MPKVHHVKKARKARPSHEIEVGDSYYWWKFRNRRGGTVVYSKTYPKPQQLTRSEFYSTIYDIQDMFNNLNTEMSKEDLENDIGEIKNAIEELRDEQEEKRSNMPDHLQDVGSGELLQERYDALDEWYNDLDNLDFSDEDQSVEELLDEIPTDYPG